jgi:hypothetical protein
VTSCKPAVRYQDIRRNVAKIREYLTRGGGLDQVLTEQDMAYDAIRMCFLEISEAAIKLGARRIARAGYSLERDPWLRQPLASYIR